MVTRGRRDGDERETRRRGDGMVTRGRGEGEGNFIPIDKDLFNPLSMFHCRTHTWDGDEKRGDRMVTRRRRDVDKRERRREGMGC